MMFIFRSRRYLCVSLTTQLDTLMALAFRRNSIPPTTTLKNLQIKANAAKEEVYVDVAFWGGVVPGNEASSSF